MVSSDSRDSYLNEKPEQNSDVSLIPPEIPEKRSPVKNQRDSGYNELNDPSSMLGTPDQMVEKGVLEIFEIKEENSVFSAIPTCQKRLY